jgi:DNA invertase Pin-like site-specific DNA recombinase
MEVDAGAPPAPDFGVDESGRGPRATGSPTKLAALGYVSVRHRARIDDHELTRQAAAIDRHCTRCGWRLLALVRDVDPPNGRAWPPSLVYAIERLRAGDVSCLVVAELKRLCPSVAELGEILEAIEQAGARFVSLDPAIDTGNSSGSVAARVLAEVSGWERDRRTAMTSAARATSAIPATIQPPLRRRIVRMRGAGMTLQAIADELNDEGVPTVRGGAKWRPSSVQTALGYRRPRPLEPAG